jgi:hypothetical protein
MRPMSGTASWPPLPIRTSPPFVQNRHALPQHRADPHPWRPDRIDAGRRGQVVRHRQHAEAERPALALARRASVDPKTLACAARLMSRALPTPWRATVHRHDACDSASALERTLELSHAGWPQPYSCIEWFDLGAGLQRVPMRFRRALMVEACWCWAEHGARPLVIGCPGQWVGGLKFELQHLVPR